MPPKKKKQESKQRGPLGDYLLKLREACGLTLRQVEGASDVSNGYLSQIESGKIIKPMPHILHALFECYGTHLPKKAPTECSYERMMQLAGHITSKTGKRSGKLPTFAGKELSDEEEQKLLEYLAFLRTRK